MMVTQQQVKDLFSYENGKLFYKTKAANRVNIGDEAGTGKERYRQVYIEQKLYKTHRIIFLYHHGYLPKYIDHIDGDKTNNAITNLREASNSQNMNNRPKQKNNNSGYKGVSRKGDKWRAQIVIPGLGNKHIGLYSTAEDAARAYDLKAIEYHKEFALLNFREE